MEVTDCEYGLMALQTACKIASVSQRWRRVAIETPRIWSRIEIYLLPTTERSRRRFPAAWDAIRPRIKSVPAEITIRNVGVDHSFRLEQCKLSEIPVISTLYFFMDGPQAYDELQRLSLTGKPILESLCFDRFDMLSHSDNAYDFGRILSCFPSTRSLAFYEGGDINIVDQRQDPFVQKIEASYETSMDIPLVLSLFPRLEHLTATTCEKPYDGSSMILPHLKYFKVCELHLPSFLPFITCPNLESFHAEGTRDVEREIIGFILAHPSITTLYFEGISGTKKLITGAPQLQQLTVCQAAYSGNTACFQYPNLPSLRCLTISDPYHELSRQEFEDIVAARCLPMTHPKSELPQAAQPLDSLTIILFPVMTDQRPKWKKSPLYKEAIKTKDEGDIEELRCLSWVS